MRNFVLLQMAIKLLQGSKKPQLYDYQGMMPILPLPALKDTMRRVQSDRVFLPYKTLFFLIQQKLQTTKISIFFICFLLFLKKNFFVFLKRFFVFFCRMVLTIAEMKIFCFGFLSHGLDHHKDENFFVSIFSCPSVCFFSVLAVCASSSRRFELRPHDGVGHRVPEGCWPKVPALSLLQTLDFVQLREFSLLFYIFLAAHGS